MKLDAIDLRILEAVQRDGRITKLALAEAVGLSATPCWLRLRRLEKAGVITGYHAAIATRAIAPLTSIMLEITLDHHRASDFERFERAVAALGEVVGCWAVGGGVDYILKVMAPSIDAYQRLIDDLLAQELGIARYFTYVVTKTIKDEPTPPLSSVVPKPPTG
jgi:Lrp/AsnC family transcriptional regulator of ectoine degradation